MVTAIVVFFRDSGLFNRNAGQGRCFARMS
jgi:hypothetical protein